MTGGPYRSLNIRTKVFLAATLIIFVLLAPAIYSVIVLREISGITSRLADQDAHATVMAARLNVLFEQALPSAKLVKVNPDMAPRLEGTLVEMRKPFGYLERQSEPRIARAAVAARAALKSFAQQALSGSADDAALAREDGKVRDALLALTQAAQGNSSARTAQAKSLAQRAATLTLVSAAVGFLVAVLLWTAVLRSLGGPLKDLLAGTERVAQGRFEETIPVRAGDELGRLAFAFNRMAGALGELERMKAEFLATASHGLRTPLACAKGYLSSLASGRQGVISDESRRALMRIEEEIDRVARFVDQLLDLGRLRSGRLPMSMRELPAAAFFASVGRPFEALAEQRGIQYRIEVGEAIPPRLTADPDRLSEALINLLGNAFKYTPSGGCVTLSIGGENGWVKVEVADTGPGIPKDEVPLIFEKYFRGGSVTAEGAGLGLAITRGIVERHGGQIWAESAEGEGARFIFRVPSRQPESKPAAARPVRAGRMGGRG